MKGKFKITIIPNKYKDKLDDLIDNSNPNSLDWSKSPDWPKLIDKRTYYIFKFKAEVLILSKKNSKD